MAKQYVLKRLEGWSEEALLALAKRVVPQHPSFALEELVERLQPSFPYQIGELTRRAVVRELAQLGNLSGHLGITDFLERRVSSSIHAEIPETPLGFGREKVPVKCQ